jgi:UDP-N-acetylmuramoyl-tripeptide--D-alanyl-D-alanine ligase
MKPIFKTILKYYLKYITKLVLSIHQPVIIAVAGSSNKSFVRDEIKKILKETREIARANPKNFNTEIGLPLAILDLESGYNSYRRWMPILKKIIGAIFQKNFPKYLVLELGVSRRGDMKYLLTIVNPKISVITGITQRYLESFSDMDELAGEYSYLVKNTSKDGVVLLNYDNIRARALSKKSKAKVEYFGFSENADWRIKEITKKENGQEIKIEHKGEEKKYLVNLFGEHHAYALAAGLVVKNYIN